MLVVNDKLALICPQMAKIINKSGENEWLLKFKSGELYFNVAKLVTKEKCNPEQALCCLSFITWQHWPRFYASHKDMQFRAEGFFTVNKNLLYLRIPLVCHLNMMLPEPRLYLHVNQGPPEDCSGS